MTDGTSQGLFIVVAIVIFGIFVVLAYILFEDTLSPSLANMFTEATEQANHRLGYKIDVTNILIRDYTGSMNVINQTKNSMTFSSDGGSGSWRGDGIYFPARGLGVGKEYKLSYDFTVLDGDVYSLGGHIVIALPEDTLFKINGEVQDSPYISGVKYDFARGETYSIDLEFSTNNVYIDEDGNMKLIEEFGESGDNTSFYIQPNRYDRSDREDIVFPAYTVKVDNIRFETK